MAVLEIGPVEELEERTRGSHLPETKEAFYRLIENNVYQLDKRLEEQDERLPVRHTQLLVVSRLARVLAVFPAIRMSAFIPTTMIALVLLLVGTPLTEFGWTFVSAQLPLRPINVWYWGSLAHLIGYVIVVVLWYRICVRVRLPRLVSATLACTLPVVIVGAILIVNDVILKKALGLPRPEGYIELDPLAVLAQRLLGKDLGSEGAPSGFAVRQVGLLMLMIWLSTHSRSTPGWRSLQRRRSLISSNLQTGIVVLVGSILVVFVFIQRLTLQAHQAFDLVTGMAFGILLFWTAAALMVAIVPRFRGHLVRAATSSALLDLGAVWLMIALLVALYSQRPLQWLGVALVLAIVVFLVQGTTRTPNAV